MPTVPPPTAIGALTIDCDDAEAMGGFYIEGLGGERDPFHHDVCVRVDGLLLLFRSVPNYQPPSWPGSDMQMHFEIYVDDLARQEQRLIGGGATKPEHQDRNDPGLVVLLDPAGHPFCILERPTSE
jgi:hypothetical protein